MNNLTDDDLTGSNHGELYANSPLKYLTALSIIGDKVHNEAEERMGEIKDIMIDITTGKIDYFIVEFGGFLGIGIKYFAIPFRLLQVDAQNKRFLFSQAKSTLDKAPGFDLDHWPHTNIHFEQVHSYWGFMG
jgi:sporulation protein YlmC with PRC-barrel domain